MEMNYEREEKILSMFEEILKAQQDPSGNYAIASDMAYLYNNTYIEEPMTCLTLASKVWEAHGGWFTLPLLHEEHLDAIRYLVEYGINDNHSPQFPPLSPEDTLTFLLRADVRTFGALVEIAAANNQDHYEIDSPNFGTDIDGVTKAINNIPPDRYMLSGLLKRAFENKEKENFYASGPYSVGFEDRPFETLIEVCYKNVPVLSGNTLDKQFQLCTGEGEHPYDELLAGVFMALPGYSFTGELFEAYAGEPEQVTKYARYFCGDFDGVITKEEHDALRDSGELYSVDTLNYEPVFDGKIYPTLADSSSAQISKYGYHYDDDRRKKPSLKDQIQSAASKKNSSRSFEAAPEPDR